MMAVTGGFEPPSPVSKTAGLANQWFQPLTHVTESIIKTIYFPIGKKETADLVPIGHRSFSVGCPQPADQPLTHPCPSEIPIAIGMKAGHRILIFYYFLVSLSLLKGIINARCLIQLVQVRRFSSKRNSFRANRWI